MFRELLVNMHHAILNEEGSLSFSVSLSPFLPPFLSLSHSLCLTLLLSRIILDLGPLEDSLDRSVKSSTSRFVIGKAKRQRARNCVVQIDIADNTGAARRGAASEAPEAVCAPRRFFSPLN